MRRLLLVVFALMSALANSSLPAAEILSLPHKVDQARRSFAAQPNAQSAAETTRTILPYARELARQGSAECVDYFYLAAAFAWHGGWQTDAGEDDENVLACRRDYHEALRGLLRTGIAHQRLDPARELRIVTPQGPLGIPVTHHGFPWLPEDFDCLVDLGPYQSDELSCIYRWCGIGVPLVVLHQKKCQGDPRELFLRNTHPFAATVLLRPSIKPFLPEGAESPTGETPPVLEFYDPLRIRETTVADRPVRLAGDISAPLKWVLDEESESRATLAGFLNPWANPSEEGLFTFEPYQPGKFPIVFVHGLLSDTLAWVNVANQLRADPVLNERFQIWVFSYPTGEDFLESAADLRESLQLAVGVFDAEPGDPALWNMVLVGHSMGGLLSKLQVTASGEQVWNAYSWRSFDRVRMDEPTRRAIARTVYFQPQPFVRRVIYVGVPHGGGLRGPRSALRQNVLGGLVRYPLEDRLSYLKLKLQNPLAFRYRIRRRLPSSVDMMSPRSPLIAALNRLPVDPAVHSHTIYGIKPTPLHPQVGDGLVPVSSARRVAAESELLVRERHIDLQEHPQTIAEIKRLLCLQLQMCGVETIDLPNEAGNPLEPLPAPSTPK